ncbi:MAG TPA: hypothetical protein VKB78_06790 [Pirellulales bacterium]|nr:hypothetical protein [Pirellulales bacterium]
MSWFTEDSTPVLVIGIITVAILLLAFVKTSHLKLLYAIGGVVIIVATIVFIEKHTVTDTKRIRALLDSAAAAAERNDVAGVLDAISPNAQSLRQEVSRQLPQFEIQSAYIRGLDIKINRFNNPPSAVATFIGHIEGRMRNGGLAAQHIPVQVKATLVRGSNDRWFVESAEWQLGIGVGGGGQ